MIVTYVLSVFWRKRDEYRVGHGHFTLYSANSPQQRTDSQSDYSSSDFSHVTNTTQIGVSSPCADKSGTNLPPHDHMINPPPSLISTARHSIALSEDGYSNGPSEYNLPPPPAPSLNYDNISGNMSFSVSQTHFPATINNAGGSSNAYHFQYSQQEGGVAGGHAYGIGSTPSIEGGVSVGGRQLGRNPNPLHRSGGGAGGGAGGGGGAGTYLYQIRGGLQNASGAPSNQANRIAFANYHTRLTTTQQPDITELDSVIASDTESTVSLATDNPDVFPYDTSMPHAPPPGRHPSPVTVYSEYPVTSRVSSHSSTSSFTPEV